MKKRLCNGQSGNHRFMAAVHDPGEDGIGRDHRFGRDISTGGPEIFSERGLHKGIKVEAVEREGHGAF